MKINTTKTSRTDKKGKWTRGGTRKSELVFKTRKKFCRFCIGSADKDKAIDYKDVKRLEVFVTERGKIVSSRYSGNCAKHQRRVVDALKKARFLSLLPYIR
ncbi:MAG: 30S ribosomal protein S18 [Candidatus Omnitrophota bacterium]|nr:30S ribosomal protein S18 [Candidatus Omnitrophota bacterium]